MNGFSTKRHHSDIVDAAPKRRNFFLLDRLFGSFFAPGEESYDLREFDCSSLVTFIFFYSIQTSFDFVVDRFRKYSVAQMLGDETKQYAGIVRGKIWTFVCFVVVVDGRY